MIFYITSPTYKEIISSTIKEQEQLILAGGEEGEDIMLYSFIKTNSATLLSGIDILVVDLSACCDIDEKIIDALEMLKMTNDDVRIIILASYRHPGDVLLTKCFQMAIYDIICTDDFLQIKEELEISLLRGKQYKDALQFKEVSSEQIVVKTEIKQTVNKVMIGIVGSEHRMGVTHNAIVLTNFLRKKGYMVALAECNRHKTYSAICENQNCQMQEGFFTLNGVDIYPEVEETLLGIILGKSYNFIVCDYGDFESCDRVNFNKSEIRIIITGAKAWEIAQVNKIFEEVANITTLEGYHYCFNFVPEVDKPDVLGGMGTLKNVHFLKYTENPYMATSFSDAEEILKEYLPSVPITFEKKSLFPFGSKKERKKMSDGKKKILYEQFTEKSNGVKEQQELGEKYGVTADKIVIKKESAGAKLLSISYSLVAVFFKIIIGGIVIGLISLALTVLINTELRNAVLEIIKTW